MADQIRLNPLTGSFYAVPRASGGGDVLEGGTGVTVDEGIISIGQSVGSSDNVTFNNLAVNGDFTVSGTTTTLNTTTLDVEDINITVANGSSSAATSDGAGLTVDLGSDGNATFTYDSTNDQWTTDRSLAVNGVITSSDGIDANTLDSEPASFYLDYENLTNTPPDASAIAFVTTLIFS